LTHGLDDETGPDRFRGVKLIESRDLMALICEQTGRCHPAYSGPDNGDAHGLKVPEIMWHTAYTACTLGVCMEMHKGASMKQGAARSMADFTAAAGVLISRI